MKLKTICRFAAQRAVQRLFICMVTFFLCLFAFLLVLFSVFSYQYTRQGRIACEEWMNGGAGQAGGLNLTGDSFGFEKEADLMQFIKEVSEMEEVTGIGDCGMGGNGSPCFEELIKRQNELEQNEGTEFWMLFMNPEAASICRMKLQEGREPAECEVTENEVLLYLGSSYSDIPVGTVYEMVIGEETCHFCVAGILEEDSKWLDENIYGADGILQMDYMVELDNLAIAIIPEVSSPRITYTVKKGYELKETEKKIKRLAEKYGLTANYAVLSEVIEAREQKNAKVIRVTIRMLYFIGMAILIILMCTQMADILDNTKYFGIFYANGASTRDFILLLLGENLLKMIAAYGSAVVLGYFILQKYFDSYGIVSWQSGRGIYLQHTVRTSFFVGMVLAGVAAFIPILWLVRQTPVELMGGYDT